MKFLKYALISIPIFIIGFLVWIDNQLSMPHSDYASCIKTHHFGGDPPRYKDGKSVCKSYGNYTEEIDGIVYEFPSNEPFKGLIKYYDDNDWENPVLLEWYESGVLIGQQTGTDYEACMNETTLKALKEYPNTYGPGPSAWSIARDTCQLIGSYLQEIDGILYALESGEPLTGEIIFKDDNDKGDSLYLIYGHDFSHRIMDYKNGKLDGLSSYFDQGGNPVLLESYEDGVLTFQSSGAHEAVDRGINYGPKCKLAYVKGWRSCPKMRLEMAYEEAEEIFWKHFNQPDNGITTLTRECIYLMQEFINESYIGLNLREIHNEKCGGDPNTDVSIAYFRINEDRELWMMDYLDGNYYRIGE